MTIERRSCSNSHGSTGREPTRTYVRLQARRWAHASRDGRAARASRGGMTGAKYLHDIKRRRLRRRRPPSLRPTAPAGRLDRSNAPLTPYGVPPVPSCHFERCRRTPSAVRAPSPAHTDSDRCTPWILHIIGTGGDGNPDILLPINAPTLRVLVRERARMLAG